jgi:hypothetical protein
MISSKMKKNFQGYKKYITFAPGEMAEWSNAAVLKTVVPQGTGGSNPSSSAKPLGSLAERQFSRAFSITDR